MSHEARQTRLRPTLISFDVFGTLINVRESSYGAFERILAEERAAVRLLQARSPSVNAPTPTSRPTAPAGGMPNTLASGKPRWPPMPTR